MGGAFHRPQFDLPGAPVAGASKALDAVLHELPKEATLLEAKALGNLQDDVVPPAVVVHPHVHCDEQDTGGPRASLAKAATPVLSSPPLNATTTGWPLVTSPISSMMGEASAYVIVPPCDYITAQSPPGRP